MACFSDAHRRAEISVRTVRPFTQRHSAMSSSMYKADYNGPALLPSKALSKGWISAGRLVAIGRISGLASVHQPLPPLLHLQSRADESADVRFA